MSQNSAFTKLCSELLKPESFDKSFLTTEQISLFSKVSQSDILSELLLPTVKKNNYTLFSYLCENHTNLISHLDNNTGLYNEIAKLKNYNDYFNLLDNYNIKPTYFRLVVSDNIERNRIDPVIDLLKLIKEPKEFNTSDNYLDELVSNFKFERLSQLKGIGFNISDTIEPETQNKIHALSNLKGIYYKENNTNNIVKLFHFYKDNGTSFNELNKYFNEIIFNLPVRAIKELTNELGLHIAESHKKDLVTSLLNNEFDNYSFYRKDGIEKLETIIETGISFSEINKNEYLLQSALEQDGGITFIKYLLDRGASLVKLQQLHNESLINYVVKNTHTINSSVLTLLIENGIKPDNNTLKCLHNIDSLFINNTKLVEKMVIANKDIVADNFYPFSIRTKNININPFSSNITLTHNRRIALNLISHSFLNNASLYKKIHKIVNEQDKINYINQLLPVLEDESSVKKLLNILISDKKFNFSSFISNYDNSKNYISEELYNEFREKSVNHDKKILEQALSHNKKSIQNIKQRL